MHQMLLADSLLARRLERAEAHANACFVDARASLSPATGATWQDLDGTWAMFDGVDSPLTQSFGLGLFAPPSAAHLARLTAFFTDRGADSAHEVSPMADPSLLSLLAAQGYVAVEWSALLVQRLGRTHRSEGPESLLTVRQTNVSEGELWAAVAAEGWGEQPGLGGFMRDLGRVSARARSTVCFVVEEAGQPVAAGSLHMHEGVALLTGASTIPRFRQRGAQRVLLDTRLRFAIEHGCELAMMAAAPGSGSQRNAQRAGFDVAYTRVKFGRSTHRT
jgi:hypothetical protein